MRSPAVLVCSLVVACGGDGGASPVDFDSGSGDDGGNIIEDSATPLFGDSAAPDSRACDPPDMLIVLDRSDSMGESPGKAADGGALPSKWKLAEAAVVSITAPPADTRLRFGLEVLPKASGSCGAGDTVVPMGLSSGTTIASTLSTTSLMLGTPIGGALKVAVTTLASAKVAGRDQYVILVTDGGETCTSGGPLPVVQALAAAGVKTYIVGFGGAVDESLLNDLACAGLTASNFATSCTKGSTGYTAKSTSTALYYSAQDGTALEAALSSITGKVCCGCSPN